MHPERSLWESALRKDSQCDGKTTNITYNGDVFHLVRDRVKCRDTNGRKNVTRPLGFYKGK